jgi:hypothetical protein
MTATPDRARQDQAWLSPCLARWLAGLLGAALLLLTWPAVAAPDLFEIREVAVEATAESPLAAREQALAQARHIAFARLLERLTPLAPSEIEPLVPGDEVLIDLVRDFEVAREKSSATRWLGTLTLRFEPERVRGWLGRRNIPFAARAADPVLVLPVFEQNGRPVLFEEPNPWLRAWAERAQGTMLVPIVVPTGDLDDLVALGAREAIAGDINALGARYGTARALLVQARFEPSGPDEAPEVTVAVTDLGTEPPTMDIRRFRGKPQTPPERLLHAAADAVVARLEENWKTGGDVAPTNTLAVVLPLASLRDWLGLRQEIEAVPMIKEVELRSLSAEQAEIVLHFAGSQGDLAETLRQRGFALAQMGGRWQLARAGAFPAAWPGAGGAVLPPSGPPAPPAPPAVPPTPPGATLQVWD